MQLSRLGRVLGPGMEPEVGLYRDGVGASGDCSGAKFWLLGLLRACTELVSRVVSCRHGYGRRSR